MPESLPLLQKLLLFVPHQPHLQDMHQGSEVAGAARERKSLGMTV